LLARLCERTVGDHPFAVSNPNAGRCCRRLQTSCRLVVATRLDFLGESLIIWRPSASVIFSKLFSSS
jgi:hypothetical protein